MPDSVMMFPLYERLGTRPRCAQERLAFSSKKHGAKTQSFTAGEQPSD